MRLILISTILVMLSGCFGEKFTCESESALKTANELLVKQYEQYFYKKQSAQKSGSTGSELFDALASFYAQSINSKINNVQVEINSITTTHSSKENGKKICKAKFNANAQVFTKFGNGDYTFSQDATDALSKTGSLTYTVEQGQEKNQLLISLFINDFDPPPVNPNKSSPSNKLKTDNSNQKSDLMNYLLRPVK